MNDPAGTKNGKIRLMLIVPSLKQGGLERVCVRTARLLDPEKYETTIAVFDGSDPAYDVSGLSVRDLDLPSRSGLSGKALNLFRRCLALKRLKKRLGIQVSYSLGQTANLANIYARAGDRILCGIRSFQDFDNPEKLKKIVRRSDEVVCCSRDMADEIKNGYTGRPVHVLYNPVSAPECPGNCEDPGTVRFLETHHPCLASMGRRDEIKGFWHLIKAFSLFKKEEEGREAGLLIIGAGDFSPYRKLAAELDIAGSVMFTGLLKDPFPVLKKTDLYVLTSIHEGFPNALIEALSLGVPALSADCRSGPSEILTDGADCGELFPVMDETPDFNASVITEEERALAAAMKRLFSDPQRMERYRKNAPLAAARFSDQAYLEQFGRIIAAAGIRPDLPQ